MSTKQILAAVAAGTAITTFAATVPNISDVTMAQSTSSRLVTITYNVDAEAVITLDIQTNATANADTGWASIGGEAVWNAAGDVWKKVASGAHTITWRPDLSWPDHKIEGASARAVVTAWALDNTPDYMVVDLAAEETVRYYPAVEFLPCSKYGQTGAVTNNVAFKTSSLLMRKIMAAGVEWTMGSADSEIGRREAREKAHKVTLPNNYYIGVFEITQAQWKNIATNSSAMGFYTVSGDMRPMDQVCYNEVRNAANTTVANTSYNYPNDPNPSSFLGLLRLKTGLDFDLPSEAQWEFAARAGNGSGYWGDGSLIAIDVNYDSNLDKLGRYANTCGSTTENSAFSPSQGGTSIVGSYAPNEWGLYDMHGNVWELCLDWYQDDISSLDANVWVNISSENSEKTVSGNSGEFRVRRSGRFNSGAPTCRSAFRASTDPATRKDATSQKSDGVRVVCRAGLQ